MTWENLQQEVLEQFIDPQWHGMSLGADQLLADQLVNVADDFRRHVSRKRDDDFVERVLEVAATRFVWNVFDLAEASGYSKTRSIGCTIGRCLAGTPGWVHLRDAQEWTNKTALLAWCRGQTDLNLAEVTKQTGVKAQRLSAWLKADGWVSTTKRSGRGVRRAVWNKQEAA